MKYLPGALLIHNWKPDRLCRLEISLWGTLIFSLILKSFLLSTLFCECLCELEVWAKYEKEKTKSIIWNPAIQRQPLFT